MQADIPGGAIASKDMGEAAGLGVLLKHQHLFASHAGQQAGCSHAANARSDDDGVVHLVPQLLRAK